MTTGGASPPLSIGQKVSSILASTDLARASYSNLLKFTCAIAAEIDDEMISARFLESNKNSKSVSTTVVVSSRAGRADIVYPAVAESCPAARPTSFAACASTTGVRNATVEVAFHAPFPETAPRKALAVPTAAPNAMVRVLVS